MASSQDDDDSDEWDKSTSEIQSEDSDELFDKRPNRWRGPPQSWRTITEEDRLTYNALERLRNQDLSVHLYNAFALRQTPQEADAREGSYTDAETGRRVAHREPWVPPKGWASWPLGARLVPPDDFMKRTEDEDEAFTFRRLEREIPSAKLEEVVSANILRFAKEKFSKRCLGETTPPSAGVKVKLEPLSSENESVPSEAESEDDGDMEGTSGGQPQTKTRAPVATFKPAVATDDDVSYELIRPSARRILEKLDQTLSILHNARMASAQNLIDSAESSSEDAVEHDEKSHRSRRTSRASSGRAPSHSMPHTPKAGGGETTTTMKRKKSNRGRPPKYVQREGESEQDFLLRRAKAQKKKQPARPDSEAGDGETTAAEDQKIPRKRRRRRTRRRESMTEDTEYWMQKKLERLNLRDWSDVMGAAALAGFSPRVVARATQRCANLFGQGMDMHTVNETAISTGINGIETTRYEPGNAETPSSSESEHDEKDLDVRQARSISRQCAGVAPGRMVSSVVSDEEDEGGGSSRKHQKRSSSRGTTAGQHYCPHADCPRALKGFGRPFNLKRHIKLVHGGESVEEVRMTPSVEEDDLDGGVHRDGFLQPVRIQRGWRSEDTRTRAKRRTARKRQRNESSAEDDESGSRESDSEESETASES